MYGTTAQERLHRTADAFYEGIGTPYAKQLQQRLRDHGLSALLQKGFDVAAYHDPYEFSGDYAAYNFVRKLKLPGDVKRLTVEAEDRFLRGEDRIRAVNSQLRSKSCKHDVEGVIHYARQKILEILGFEPNMQEFARGCGWGPGATKTLKRSEASLDKKLIERRLSVTGRALPIARSYLTHSRAWIQARLGSHVTVDGPCSLLANEFLITESSRFSTVDKDGTARRTIDIQPTLNLFLQKGAGKMIRKRLKRFGVDLDDQSMNQRLASLAYSLGYATLDLTEASSSVSTELVKLLLPQPWWWFLDRLRVQSILIRGEERKLEMFSGMGNGFTFELESLIFYALAFAVVRKERQDTSTPIAVYGDDIIVAQLHAERVKTVLTEVGFLINEDKSYVQGKFFESCGKHYFCDVDVTPPIQKDLLAGVVDILRCHNRLWRWAARMSTTGDLDARALRAVKTARTLYDSAWRDFVKEVTPKLYRKSKTRHRASHPWCQLKVGPRQPSTYEGDVGILTSPVHFSTDPNGRQTFWGLSSKAVKRSADESALLAEWLRREPDSRGSANPLGFRGMASTASYGQTDSPRGAVVCVSRLTTYRREVCRPRWRSH